jgi:DNA-binding MarR family transcriptional regulator
MLSLLKSIRRIVRANDLGSRALQKSSGLTAPQLAVLTAVGSLGEISTTKIAEHVDLSAATVVTILDNLERHQLVTRHRSSEDRRIVFTRPTKAGVAELAKVQGPFNAAFARRFTMLPPERRRQMTENLAALADLMNAPDGMQPAKG